MPDSVLAAVLDPQSLLLASVFFAVVFLIMGAAAMAGPRRVSIDRRVGRTAAGPQPSIRSGTGSIGLKAWLRRLDRSLAPQEEQKRGAVRRRMLQAGFYGPHAATVYYSVRVGLALALPAAVGVGAPLLMGSINPQTLFLVTVGAMAVGFFGPALVISQRIAGRQTAVRQSFPDALDMLLVCVEAGLGLNAAMARVAEELAPAHPLVSEHLRMVGLEMQAGVQRDRALRNLSERIGIEEVGSLTTLLNQAESMGVSVSQTLRVFAGEMRRKRLTRAEEHANKLPVKMAGPLAGMIMPSFLILILTPTLIRMVRYLLPALQNTLK